ncbi:MAG: hypothetical protein ACLFP2_03475 [Candidatus Woesearchaeota archaeon]
MKKYIRFITYSRLFIIAALITTLTIWLRFIHEGFLPVGNISYRYMIPQNTSSFLLDNLSLDPFILLVYSSVSSFLIIVLSYFILKRYIREDMAILGLILFVMSPAYIFMILQPAASTFALLFLLIAWFIHPYSWISFIFLLVIPIIDFYSGIIAFILYFPFAKYHRKNLWLSLMILISFIPYIYHRFKVHDISFGITDMGAELGLGLFFLLLSVIGLAHLWRHKRRYWYLFLSLVLVFIVILFDPFNHIFLVLPLSAIGAYGFLAIFRRNWALGDIKQVSVFLITLGLLFSMVAYIDKESEAFPTQDIKSSYEYIEGTPGKVLSASSYATWTRYFSGKDPVYDHGANESILHTRSLSTAQEFLGENKVSHVWVHPKMLSGEVWDAEDEGLLFVLSSEEFEMIYDEEIRIWLFLDFNKIPNS